MLIIGICDDETIFREQIRNMCHQYFERINVPFQCVEFKSAEEVLAYKGDALTLLFLDVEMDGESGIELKDELEKTDCVWRIVFVTSHEEVIGQAFGLKTLGFAKKPVEYKSIEKWLSLAFEEQEKNKIYHFTTEKGDLFIQENDIAYIESEGNYSYIYTKKDKIFVCESLKKCEEILTSDSFLRVHKSYMINMNEIKEISADQAIMTGKASVPIGRKYREEAKKAYLNHLKAVALGRL